MVKFKSYIEHVLIGSDWFQVVSMVMSMLFVVEVILFSSYVGVWITSI